MPTNSELSKGLITLRLLAVLYTYILLYVAHFCCFWWWWCFGFFSLSLFFFKLATPRHC